MARRLNPQLIYCLPVKGVEPGNQFTKHNLPHYVHIVFFQDGNGEVYRGEYITNEPQQSVFAPGIRQPFKVSEVQDKGDVIVPLIGHNQAEEKTMLPGYIKPIHGESYSAAVTIAKDLLVTGKAMQEITDADVTNMLRHADMINDYLVKKQTERILSL